MRVAVAQVALVAGGIDENVATIVQAARSAVRTEASLLVLPEGSLTGYDDARLGELAVDEVKLAGSCEPLADVSSRTGVTIVASGVIQRPRGTTMSVVVIDPRGRVSTPYDKRFLDSDERPWLVNGHHPAAIEVDGTICGLGICHDLSFPEQAMDSADLGATVLLQPSLCVAGSEHRQDVRAAARALDTNSWLILASPVGRCGRLEAVGRSTVVDPDGVIVDQLDDQPGTIVVDIDHERAVAARDQRRLAEDRAAAIAHATPT